MAIAMGTPGGSTWRHIPLVFTHFAGAVLGGAVVGFLLGVLGETLPPTWEVRAAIIGGSGLLALVWGARRRGRSVGLRCQVPRRFGRAWTGYGTVCTWGAMLGSGFLTLIPYTGFLVLPAVQLVAGPAVGAAAGGIFGLVRQGHVALPLTLGYDQLRTMEMLETMKQTGSVLNPLPPLAAFLFIAIGLPFL